MERGHFGNVNQGTPNAPLPMLPPKVSVRANQVPQGQGQRTPNAPLPLFPPKVPGNANQVPQGQGLRAPNAPLPMLPPKVPANANQIPQGQGQRADANMGMDAKKLKRIAASREYSQRYRHKQMHYIAQLEASARALQAELAINGPKVEYITAHNAMLRAENGAIKEKISALSEKLMEKEVEYHELKKERERLKHFSLLQQQSSTFGASSSQPNPYPNQMMNMGMAPPGFYQFMGAAPRPPMMQNQKLKSEFGYDPNNGDGNDRNQK